MRYRLFRRPLQAPKMSVRSDVPMRLKLLVGLIGFAIALAIGVVLGRIGTGPARAGVDRTIGRLMQENQALHEERAVTSAPVESQRIMESATIKELGEQVARLEADNARLKDDVSFFEAATAGRAVPGSVDAAGGIALRRFQVTEDRATHRVRYRILLTQDAKAQKDFVGTLQLVATVQRGTSPTASQLVFPDPASPDPGATDGGDGSRGAVIFRSYKRIDGSLDLPQDAVLKSVEARVLERGAIRVRLAAVPD